MLRCWGVWGCVAWCALAVAGLAQDEPRITILQPGTERLREDVKFLFDLAPTNLRKQWKTLDEYLDSFAQGLDPKQPLRIELVFGGTELQYDVRIPIAKLEGKGGLLDNLGGFGWDAAKKGTGLWTLKQQPLARSKNKKKTAATPPPKPPFYLRDLHKYAWISLNEKSLQGTLPQPLEGVKEAIAGKIDVAALILNDGKSLAGRRTKFQELRKQLEAAIKFKRGETEDAFALRKMSSAHGFDEMERFLVETENLTVQWTTDAAAKIGHGDLKLTALSETELRKSIELLVNEPSLFTNVKLNDKPILSAKINMALDPMRLRHATELFPALKPVFQADMDSRPHLNAEGKAAAKEAIGILFEMLTEGLEPKVLDLFVDVHPAAAGGKNTGLCGIRAADGSKAMTALALFPKIREGWKVEANVAEHAGVALHKVTVAPHRLKEFSTIFGDDPTAYVGTGPKTVWGAAGVNALDELKAAIYQSQQPAEPTTDPHFFQAQMKVGPWIELLEIIRQNQPKSDKPLSDEEKDAEKQLNKIRKLAMQAFQLGNDNIKGWLRRDGEQVRGEMDITEDILRFLGTVTADFTAENLQ